MNKQNINHFLRVSASFMFFGRFWEHFRWLGPYRDFFYNPRGFIIKFITSFTGENLTEIYNNHYYENIIIFFSKGLGIVFLISGIIILFYDKLYRLKFIVYIALIGLIINYFGILMGKHFDMWGIFFEHLSQFTSPILFLYSVNNKFYSKNIIYLAQVSISITFIGHGLFAVGYYPQPGNFADMVIIGFNLEEETARFFLIIIGWLDFVFGFVLLIPFWFLRRKIIANIFNLFLWYGIIWGGLTAIARFYVPFSKDLFFSNISQDLHEVFIRFPHFITPLVIWLILRNKTSLIYKTNL